MAKDQTLKIIDMQSFIGGEADNPYMGPANCCARAVGVDLRTKPGIARLETDLKEELDLDGDEITYIVNGEEFGLTGKYYICYRRGKDAILNVDGTDAYTFPATNNASRCCAMALNEGNSSVNMYYYVKEWTGSNVFGVQEWSMYVYRSKIDSSGNVTDFQRIATRETYGNGRIFAKNMNGKVYISFGNNVFTQDDYEIIPDKGDLILPEGEVIVGMTEYLGTIKIYSVMGNDTYMYTWDGVDYLPTTRQVWKGIKLVGVGSNKGLGVVNDGAYDYVLSESGDLYVVAGTQIQKIKTSNSELDKNFSCLLQMYNGVLYIGGQKGEVYTYSTKFPGIEKSLIASYIVQKGGGSDVNWSPILMNKDYICTDICKVETFNNVYNNVTHKLKDFNNDDLNITGGYIQTMYYTNDQWKDMAFEMMKLNFKINGGYIYIYYRTRLEKGWTLFKTIYFGDYNSQEYDKERKTTISIREFNENNPGEFVGIQFMFVLQRYIDNKKTPEIGRCTVFLREINENK